MVSTMGRRFLITTFGESASKYVGTVVDGIPAGLPISEKDLAFELSFRKTGRRFVSGRRENDIPEIVSGIYEGYTTGSPLTVLVRNEDPQPTLYENVKHEPRPGHADLAFIKKYGRENWDYVGGGRSSARETLSRVIGGTIAKKLILLRGTQVGSYLKSIGNVSGSARVTFQRAANSKHFLTRAVSERIDKRFSNIVERLLLEGDSAGGIVETIATNVPEGLGDPVFGKLKAVLAYAIMSIPAVVGFEYGLGFDGAKLKGSEASDSIVRNSNGTISLERNLSGGILGGITTGSELVVRCAFKPSSSIRIPAKTIDLDTLEDRKISVIGRHDPVVAIRGVAVVEAMVSIVLADYSLYEGIIPVSRIERGPALEMEEKWENYMREFTQ